MVVQVRGVVVRGFGEGGKLGYPTANLELSQGSPRPGPGVYACWVQRAGGPSVPGVLVSGVHWEKPNVPRIEVYLIGFSGDLYGVALTVKVQARLRDIVQTDDVAALRHQIKLDLERTKQLLKV